MIDVEKYFANRPKGSGGVAKEIIALVERRAIEDLARATKRMEEVLGKRIA